MVQINVDINFDGADINAVRQDLFDAVQERTGQDLDTFEHLLFCVPNGSLNDGDGWAAFAVTGGQVGSIRWLTI